MTWNESEIHSYDVGLIEGRLEGTPAGLWRWCSVEWVAESGECCRLDARFDLSVVPLDDVVNLVFEAGLTWWDDWDLIPMGCEEGGVRVSWGVFALPSAG